MSNIYIQEPPTKGKVLLETSVGDIEIELWSRECPKACRNFIQLCMENYYNKTIFHRVVKDFIVQGGDPSGTGHGGESIYGSRKFKDEIHSRLRFVRRGLVAMANAGKDDNGSQFFFTFGPTQELQNKHTIFGKVVGDTIYNMLKLQEVGVVDERPENPHKILRTKVLINPFNDIEPRKLIQMISEEKKDKKPKSKMKATKDFGLLSFGDEAEEEEEDLIEASKTFASVPGKSSHDLLKDPKLSSEVGIQSSTKEDERDLLPQDEQEKLESQLDAETVKKKLKRTEKSTSKSANHVKTINAPVSAKRFEEDEEEDEDLKEKVKKREDILKEIKALKKEMKKERRSGKVVNERESEDSEDDGEDKITEEEAKNEMLLEFHREKSKYAKSTKANPKKGSKREELTMKLLEQFKSKLHAVKEGDEGEEPGEEKKKETLKTREQEEEEEEEDLNGDGWMANKLQFADSAPVLAKDASSKDDDWFDIYDPRNPVNKRRRGEKRKHK